MHATDVGRHDGNETGLRSALARFQAPILARSLMQISTTLALFLGTCTAMYFSLDGSYWVTLGLSVVAAGLTVRLFIVQHDCGHGSFFRSARANDLVGMLCSLFTFTPYSHWRRQHAGHHANWNNLDKRWSGADIYSHCLTLDEYRALPRWRRLAYRASRHPLVANLVLPPLIFLVLYRLPFDTPSSWRRERWAVYLHDAALVAIACSIGFAIGFDSVALVQLPVIVIASIIGVGLFSVQHKYEGVVWEREGRWTAQSASLASSSYLHLPRLLQWATGNIGFHHVHHLNPRIPNYRLEACHRAVPGLQGATMLGLRAAVSSLFLALWDEDRRRMVPFGAARAAQAGGTEGAR